MEEAARANRLAMYLPGGYRARVESENATLGRREGRIEGATLLEQTSGLARWSNDGGFEFHVAGSRSYPNAIPLSRIAYVRIGWIVPTLTGERMQVITRAGLGATKFAETLRGPLAPEIVVHPFASDRERFYRYTGEDHPVRRVMDGEEHEVFAIQVNPVTNLSREETLFEGEVDLDTENYSVVRMVGRFIVVGRPRRHGLFHLDPDVTLVYLMNQRLADGTWVPRVQRYELMSSSKFASGYGAGRRVITRFHEAIPLPASGAAAVAASTLGYVISTAPGDSLRHFHGWRTEAGLATNSTSIEEFRQFWPNRLQPAGPPLFVVQGYQNGDFLRLNRIEGLYTGVSGIFRLRDVAPGGFLRVGGGYAWSESAWRGVAAAGWESGLWHAEAGIGRTLDVTNKFRNQFDSQWLAGLAGRDPWDYIDRLSGGVSLTRTLETSQGSIVRLELGKVSDRAVERNMEKSLFGGHLRVNRNIAPGVYWRTRALLEWHPEVSPLFAHDGVGLRAEVERGDGDLDYTRIEGRIVVRRSLSRVFLIGRLHGGAVLGDSPPPQQLFELGGSAGMPGYDYKEFAGDRAALLRVRATYPLSFLDRPIRVGQGLMMPSFAPAVSLGFQAAYTDVGTAGGAASVRALGDKREDKTDKLILDPDTGDPLPASVVTGRIRTSIDLRIGFFGDALAFGFARALEKGRKTRLIFALGRQF